MGCFGWYMKVWLDTSCSPHITTASVVLYEAVKSTGRISSLRFNEPILWGAKIPVCPLIKSSFKLSFWLSFWGLEDCGLNVTSDCLTVVYTALRSESLYGASESGSLACKVIPYLEANYNSNDRIRTIWDELVQRLTEMVKGLTRAQARVLQFKRGAWRKTWHGVRWLSQFCWSRLIANEHNKLGCRRCANLLQNWQCQFSAGWQLSSLAY